MKSFEERINEKRNACATIEDWKEAYEWLAQEAYDINDNLISMEKAVVEKYGEKALDEIIAMMSGGHEEDFDLSPAMKEMLAYGYKKLEMMPMEKEDAISFYQKGCQVYLLNQDNTEKKAANETEISTFVGLVGVPVTDLAQLVAKQGGFSTEKSIENDSVENDK